MTAPHAPSAPPAIADDARTIAPGHALPLAALFVWATWAAMTVALVALVWRYGSDVPLWDEWDMIPTLTGHQPVTLRWLWSQHNEHRVPLPRLILLTVDKAAGNDLRAAMYFNVAVMSSLAAAMLLVLRRVRGATLFTDAVVSLLLLNWGHAVNFIWGWQVQFFASTALAITALLLIVRGRYGSLALAGVGLCTVLLPLCGANGLGLVPALAVWLGGVGFVRWRNGNRAEAAIALSAATIGLALSALYFVGYETVPYHPKHNGYAAALVSASQFVATGWGPVAQRTWPLSGWLTAVAVLVALAVTTRAGANRSPERMRAAGVLAFFGAMVSLALGLGLGRNGFEPRYVTLAAPLLLAVVAACALYAPPRAGAAVQMLMLIGAVGALWPNTTTGLAYARGVRGELATFERQLAAGVPPYKLIVRFREWLHPHDDVIAEYLPMMRSAGNERYRRLAKNPPLREVGVPLTPAVAPAPDATWDEATTTATIRAEYGHLDFELPAPVHAVAVRLRYTLRNASGTAPYLSLAWKGAREEPFTPAKSRKYSATGDRETWGRWTVGQPNEGERTVTVWIDETIGHLRVAPDLRPCEITVHELTVLTPAEPLSGPPSRPPSAAASQPAPPGPS